MIYLQRTVQHCLLTAQATHSSNELGKLKWWDAVWHLPGVTYCILLLIRTFVEPLLLVFIDAALRQIEILLIILCKKGAAIYKCIERYVIEKEKNTLFHILKECYLTRKHQKTWKGQGCKKYNGVYKVDKVVFKILLKCCHGLSISKSD